MNEEVRKWIIKALNDYKTAEKLINLSEEEIITDTLCFHCQQAVEKLLKAFLVNEEIEFGRTHSLMNFIFLLLREQKKPFILPQKLKSLF